MAFSPAWRESEVRLSASFPFRNHRVGQDQNLLQRNARADAVIE
jgi:hypothetical protein